MLVTPGVLMSKDIFLNIKVKGALITASIDNKGGLFVNVSSNGISKAIFFREITRNIDLLLKKTRELLSEVVWFEKLKINQRILTMEKIQFIEMEFGNPICIYYKDNRIAEFKREEVEYSLSGLSKDEIAHIISDLGEKLVLNFLLIPVEENA